MLELACKSLLQLHAVSGARLSTVLFHRVLSQADPCLPQELDQAGFAARIAWLKRVFNIIPLRQARDGLANRSLPPRALVITFDDGYADNYLNALPVLQAHGVSATFFVTTRYLEGGMMWNDRVVEALRSWPGTQIDLRAFELGEHALGAACTASIEAVLARLKYFPFEDREAVASHLLADSASTVERLMMTAEQIRALHAAGMEIGGHTHSHPILARLQPEHAAREIGENKAELEHVIGARLHSFAYPNGKPGRDFGPTHIQMVADAGYDLAVTTAPGTVADLRHPYEIPRFTPWDREATRFTLRMTRNYFCSPTLAAHAATAA